jgi:hypothetical protein
MGTPSAVATLLSIVILLLVQINSSTAAAHLLLLQSEQGDLVGHHLWLSNILETISRLSPFLSSDVKEGRFLLSWIHWKELVLIRWSSYVQLCYEILTYVMPEQQALCIEADEADIVWWPGCDEGGKAKRVVLVLENCAKNCIRTSNEIIFSQKFPVWNQGRDYSSDSEKNVIKELIR